MTKQPKTVAGAKCVIGTLLAALILCLTPSGLAAQDQTATANAANNRSQRFVSIDFNNVDINVFIKFISELSGRNFVIDQRVRGNVTIISPSKISVDEAYQVFLSVLEVHGFATVETGQLTKIIPAPEARTRSIETRMATQAETNSDQIVTQLIPLRFADPEEVKRLFTPMVSKNSVILSYAPTNTLMITDHHSNITRLMKILQTIDIPGVGREITVFPIQNADAGRLVGLLETIFKTTQPPQAQGAPMVADRTAAFVADERTNSIIMVASEDNTNRIRSMIQNLDQETPKGKERVHVYYLEYAVAEEVVAVLRDLPSSSRPGTSGAREAPLVSETVSITADRATNSLIITADRDDYAILMDVIRQIDIPRAMVYIEALLIEVNTNKRFELGTEWQVGDSISLNRDREGVAGAGFRGTDPPFQFSVGPGGTLIPALPPGFSVGVFGEAVNISGISFPSIAAIVSAYQRDRDVNILSTPQLLTTDNQEASIMVGRSVPFQTASSTTNNETFNSFEYRDVGKSLRITPQINKDRMVRLLISLEVSALESTTDFRPTTLKRNVDTTIMVKDGNTVVIGGLIDDTFAQTEEKVPCLGDLPGLGWLFKTRARENEKSNLYVFITPKVIQNPDEATVVSQTKKEQIDELAETQIKLYRGAGSVPADPPALDPIETQTLLNQNEPPAAGLPLATLEIPAGHAAGDGFFIQVQSLADEQTALQAARHFETIGYPIQIVPSEINGKIWYRLRTGTFPELAGAESAQADLAGRGIVGTLIMKSDP